MARLYLHPGEFIREQPFEVLAPAFYHPNEDSSTVIVVPKKRQAVNPFTFVTTGGLNPEPFRIGVDPNMMQNCAYTVEIMLDMFQKKIEFEIVQDHDIPAIFDGLDRYLLLLRTDVELGVERSIEYVKIVLAFRAEIYKMYYRFMKLNPTAMAELYPNHDVDNNIFTLMAKIGGMNYDDYKTDPLKIRAKPPYTIEEAMPRSKDTIVSNEDEFDNSLGARHSAPLSDAEIKFSIDDFLKG